MHPDARALIARFGMAPIPVEGGWYVQTWASPTVLPPGTMPGYDGPKPTGTAILGLLTDDPDGFSAFHRLPTAEIWHFCAGDPIELVLLDPSGDGRLLVLGPDVLGSHHPQVVVGPRVWMAARVEAGGSYSLFATTMAPGFTASDFEAGSRRELALAYPQWAETVAALTRAR